MDPIGIKDSRTRRRIIAVAFAAVVMGLPTLRGSFAGGDDHRLVLNHVLVNRPSLTHAVQLFTIVHRDLYQPLPLLTFSIEFAVARRLGLFEAGAEGGAWLFHLTNILLHALNTALVFLLIRRLQARTAGRSSPEDADEFVAGAAALLFAIHPFQVETIAWVNGRMMLLSTLFALGSLLALLRWLDGRGRRYGVLAILLVVLSAVSKVRAPLVILAAVAAWVHGQRWASRRFWAVWIPTAAVIGWFVWVNVGATAQADLFEEGAEHLRGPRAVRVILALAFYFEHLILPIGLTSYYPTPPLVSWSDTRTLWAAATLLVACGVLVYFCTRSRAARWGTVWFMASIADTLPFFPARNVLAADRYMYLPIIGLFWMIGDRLFARAMVRRSRPIGYAGAGVVVALLVGISWSTARWYDTPLLKTLRVATCFPDEPRVWEMTGWCYQQLGQYDQAIECAEKELRHESTFVRSGAYQLMGTAKLRLGATEEALELLRKAVETDPSNDMGAYRLATALEELGRFEEAVVQYEEAVRLAPGHNATLHKLAGVYRKLDRVAEARELYARELTNNEYEVPAVLSLAELDLAEGTPEALRRAEGELIGILAKVGEHGAARVSLGVVLFSQGRRDAAMEQYILALDDEPSNLTAATNLARLVLAGELRGYAAAARVLCHGRVTSSPPAAACAALFLAAEEPGRALDAIANMPNDPDSAESRKLLLTALERFDRAHPENPWSLAVAVEALIGERNVPAAEAFLGVLADRCRADACGPVLDRLRREVAAQRRSTP